jgi:RsiW-degrading membrane proteinase PrsW (M82 family)
MSGRGRDWRTILLAVGCVAGAFLAVVLAASMAFYAALSPAGHSMAREGTSPLDVLIPATAILFLGALAIPAAYYSIIYLTGGASPAAVLPRLRLWQGVVLLLLWIGCALLAGFLVDKDPWRWLTPVLYLVAIGIPVYFLIRLAAGGLSVGSVRRLWGILSAGMVGGPGSAIFAELGLAIVLGAVVVIYLALNPERLAALRDLTIQLSGTSSMEQAANILQPLLQLPIAFILALLFFSGFAPVVEEASKSIAIWAVFDRLETEAQGFLAGVLSGAGFGLLESLLASATPDQTWAFTLLIRGGSSMMHVVTASFTGWGIGRYRLTRRVGPLLGGFGVAVVLHSLWNAAVVTMTFGSLKLGFNAGRPEIGAILLIALGGTLLCALCIAIPVALGRINARLRTASRSFASEPAPPPTDLT